MILVVMNDIAINSDREYDPSPSPYNTGSMTLPPLNIHEDRYRVYAQLESEYGNARRKRNMYINSPITEAK